MNEDSNEMKVIGIDQGDLWSVICELDSAGRVVRREKVRTNKVGYQKFFGRLRQRRRLVMEVGTHSPWSSRLLEELGHEVIVANARRVKLISQAERKTDRVDAEVLARLGRADVALLAPIQHGSESYQQDRALLTIRDGLVRCRTRLILQARGLSKSVGERLPNSPSITFAQKVRASELDGCLPGLPVSLDMVDVLTEGIRELDRQIDEACKVRHPITLRLQQIPGVGPLTALSFVLKVEDPGRFTKSREVGPFLGLVPREYSSGSHQPQMGIPKRGDAMARRHLVQASHFILGRFGPDCDLRRFGLEKIERSGLRSKKPVVIAVARKLAVLLHHLWVSGEDYEPLRRSFQAAA